MIAGSGEEKKEIQSAEVLFKSEADSNSDYLRF